VRAAYQTAISLTLLLVRLQLKICRVGGARNTTIGNAVHHATGRRVLDLPMSIDKLL